ncbi:MAG: ATP-dependent helicase, partial [Anaerolineae bacterium]|nr:ATP-dependent helicase [Anaerolineae bacterium]
MPTRFREAQARIITGYTGGLMAVSAVPGSGKTFTLSHLAARLVQRVMQAPQAPDEEVLVVTFSNSAVNGFKRRIADILRDELGLLPQVGYRVRTLHALAHDIVRERPALVGLVDDFQIVDERTADGIITDLVQSHYRNWTVAFEQYISESIQENRKRGISQRDLPSVLTDLAKLFINRAKDRQTEPADLLQSLEQAGLPAPEFDLLHFATNVYADYQHSLAIRGAVDFSDLVRLALRALADDPAFLARLRLRWRFILEDEAQDSSDLQEQMLRLLSAGRHWVRVGDPNQAINTTFTTASPHFLVDFLRRPEVVDAPLPVSGRSSRKIIALANELVRWCTTEHPSAALQTAFFPQEILPTRPDDAQQNPPEATSSIYIDHELGKGISPDQELQRVMASLRRFLESHPDKTVAVLVPENSRGFKLAELLQAEALPFEELLRSTSGTRQAAAMVRAILDYLAAPHQSAELARLFREVWWKLYYGDEDEANLAALHKALHGFRQVEGLMFPAQEQDLRSLLNLSELDASWVETLEAFLLVVRRWLSALALPIDQLILTISQDIFDDPADLALGYHLAVLLGGYASEHPEWGLPDFARELQVISNNERRFLGFDEAQNGFEPTPGVVTIATMHASKGLEWDRI